MTLSVRRSWLLGAGALLVAAGATLVAELSHAQHSVTQHHGYLGATVRQLGDRIPPPPAGPAVVEADRRVFRATRALQGSSRWKQAANDRYRSAPSLLKDFSCASGLNLTPERTPHLASLLDNAGADGAHVAARAKPRFKRPRPYTLDEGPTCLPTKGFEDFHDYPSAHSARGWTWGLILAELLPDRRRQLLSRAQAYADSRVVCGFHSPTGAEGGRTVAVLTFNALMRNPRFKADMQQASTDLTALKQHGQVPPARQCRAEQRMKDTPY
jgi:acid phosphatase (class A)